MRNGERKPSKVFEPTSIVDRNHSHSALVRLALALPITKAFHEMILRITLVPQCQ